MHIYEVKSPWSRKTCEGNQIENLVTATVDSRLSRLLVKSDDPRRNYLSIIFRHSNAYEFENLSSFLHAHCAEDFVTHLKGSNPLMPLSSITNDSAISIVGVDPFVNLNALMSQCVPDRICRIKQSIIRNRFAGMMIVSKIVISGTLAFKVKLNNNQLCQSSHTIIVNDFKPEMIATRELTADGLNLRLVSFPATATLILTKDSRIRSLTIDSSSSRNGNWLTVPKAAGKPTQNDSDRD